LNPTAKRMTKTANRGIRNFFIKVFWGYLKFLTISKNTFLELIFNELQQITVSPIK